MRPLTCHWSNPLCNNSSLQYLPVTHLYSEIDNFIFSYQGFSRLRSISWKDTPLSYITKRVSDEEEDCNYIYSDNKVFVVFCDAYKDRKQSIVKRGNTIFLKGNSSVPQIFVLDESFY